MLLGVAIVEGAAFLVVEVLVCVGVFALDVGVEDRAVGVFARFIATGGPCVLDVLPLFTGRFVFAGEFERVDAGLVEFDGLFSFLTESGSRDDGDGG